jgi:predicted dehydrogenase
LNFNVPFIRKLSDKYKIIAVYDAYSPRTKEIAKDYNAVACGSYEEMLAMPEVDLILTLTPPEFHCEYVIKGLEAGKNVLTEKPMSLSSAECWKMVDAARKSGKVLTVNHNHRYDGTLAFNVIKEIVNNGGVGKPIYYSVVFFSGWGGYEGSPNYVKNWERNREHGGGALFSWGPHLTDMMLNLHGSDPISVYAVLSSGGWEFTGDSYTNMTLRFKDDVCAHIEIDYKANQETREFLVQGTEGLLKFESREANMLTGGSLKLCRTAKRKKSRSRKYLNRSYMTSCMTPSLTAPNRQWILQI